MLPTIADSPKPSSQDFIEPPTFGSLTRGPDAERARIVAALKASCGSEPARYRLTVWRNLPASAGRSGAGRFSDLSTHDFAEALTDDAAKVVPKGEGVCFALGSSRG